MNELSVISVLIYCLSAVRCQDNVFYQTTTNNFLNKNIFPHKYDIYGPDREIEAASCAVVGRENGHYDQSLIRKQRQYKGPHYKGKLMPDSPKNYTAEQQKYLIDLHNFYRGNVTPPAANMNFLEYDAQLAHLAQLWADGCHFKHGDPPNTTYSPGYYNQNLYWGGQPDGKQATEMFFAEHKDYDMIRQYCIPGTQCGHYIALAWARTLKMGCGVAKCSRLQWLLACHFFPTETRNTQMYKIGVPCSQCEYDDGALCYKRLCVSWPQCERNPEVCSEARCNLKCHNCGKLDEKKCKCDCPDGWDSLDCSYPCGNAHRLCGVAPGYPSRRTCRYEKVIPQRHCRLMCGTCKAVTKKSKNLCCEGKKCEMGLILNSECECVKLCPGFNCTEQIVEETTTTAVPTLSNEVCPGNSCDESSPEKTTTKKSKVSLTYGRYTWLDVGEDSFQVPSGLPYLKYNIYLVILLPLLNTAIHIIKFI